MKNEDKGNESNRSEDGTPTDESGNMAGVPVADVQENLRKKPKKGILKPSASFEAQDTPPKREKKKSAKWDEMNIIATLHPADKDYGHMKIDEPPTPYEPVLGDDEDRDGTKLDAAALADKIRLAADEKPKGFRSSSDSTDSEPDEDETPEQRAQRKEFEMKRKAHYNEFFAAKLARQLMEEDEDDEDDDDAEEGENQANEGESNAPTVPSQPPAGTSSNKK